MIGTNIMTVEVPIRFICSSDGVKVCRHRAISCFLIKIRLRAKVKLDILEPKMPLHVELVLQDCGEYFRTEFADYAFSVVCIFTCSFRLHMLLIFFLLQGQLL